MSPTLERLLLRPSVEARVQLDCVELLCVPAEPIPGCQRGLVQDSALVVVAPSGRTDADVTHSSPVAAFLPTESCWRWITHIHLVFSSNNSPPVAGSRPPHKQGDGALGARDYDSPDQGPVGDASPAVDVRSSIASSGSIVMSDTRAWSRWRARGSGRRCGYDQCPCELGPVGGGDRAIQRARSVSMAAIRCLGGSLQEYRHLAAHRHLAHRRRSGCRNCRDRFCVSALPRLLLALTRTRR